MPYKYRTVSYNTTTYHTIPYRYYTVYLVVPYQAVRYRTVPYCTVLYYTGYAAKHAEDMKFLADMTSYQPISAVNGGPHILVPFAIEDGGRLGAHAQALLRSLAIASLTKGRTPPFAKGAEHMTHNMHVSLWVRRWQQRLSTWVHLSTSRHAVRLLCPSVAAQHGHL